MPTRLPVFVHQVDTSYLQAVIGPSDEGQPFSEIWMKTHDGIHWMSDYDTHPLHIDGLDAVRARAADQAAAGRDFRPWCVIPGLNPAAEGRRAAAVALAAAETNLNHAPVLIVDIEPYYHGGPGNPQFWRSDLFTDGPARVNQFLDTFLANGGQEVWVAFDCREAHLAPISYAAWVAHPAVRLMLPQTYWTAFLGHDATSEEAIDYVNAAHGLMRSHGWNGAIGQIFPAETAPNVFWDALQMARALGEFAPSMWQRMNFTHELSAGLLAADNPWENQPLPEPPSGPSTKQRIIAQLEGALADARTLPD